MSFNNCNKQCNRLCPHLIISTSLTVVTVAGVPTLVLGIPAGTYGNCENFCIVVAQNRPATATVDMPVAISIGGVTTTVYPLVCGKTGLQATACQISGRTKIKVTVRTNATSGIFRACQGLGSCCTTILRSLPAPTTTAVATANEAEVAEVTPITVRATKTTTAKKGVEENA